MPVFSRFLSIFSLCSLLMCQPVVTSDLAFMRVTAEVVVFVNCLGKRLRDNFSMMLATFCKIADHALGTSHRNAALRCPHARTAHLR